MKMYEGLPAEISHEAHRAHKLKLVTTDGAPFRCDGCMEPGSGQGRRYRCDPCEFDLHTSCVLPESTMKHPLFGGLEFEFLLRSPPSAVDAKFCAACGYVTSGLVYRCSEKDLNLHPCCAALKMETVIKDGHMLQLCKEAKQDCLVCGQKGRPPGSSSHNKKFWVKKNRLWAYRWNYGGSDGYLHVACMKKIAAQSWEQTYLQDSPSGGVVEASAPVMKAMLQGRPSRNSEGNNTEIATRGFEMGSNIANVLST